jgi:hypothetical protein
MSVLSAQDIEDLLEVEKLEEWLAKQKAEGVTDIKFVRNPDAEDPTFMESVREINEMNDAIARGDFTTLGPDESLSGEKCDCNYCRNISDSDLQSSETDV